MLKFLIGAVTAASLFTASVPAFAAEGGHGVWHPTATRSALATRLFATDLQLNLLLTFNSIGAAGKS
jgi:hypothetical protein